MNRQEKNEATRLRILQAAAASFRSHGLSGIGVDGVAKDAAVTSGAFYVHFRSKADAFRAAIVDGLDELRAAVESFRTSEGHSWLASFVSFYLGPKRICPLKAACTLPSLSSDVERAGEQTRQAYEAHLLPILDALATGLPGDPNTARDRACAIMAMLVGGALLSRAVLDQQLSQSIASAVAQHALLAGSDQPQIQP
jgi:TetR/AcrR family transcriptional regulator, transcriptional repressor for nem operon